MNALRSFTAAMAVGLVASLLSLPANAAVVWNQGFEADAAGWLDNDDVVGFGDITQVASGTNGITSATGGGHAIASDPINSSGPFSRFDMYRPVWPGDYTASIDIYLDLGWGAGEGFDYSVAANGSDGNHRRDFIFHVTQDTSSGQLLVGASNNTNFDPREDLDTLANHAVVSSSGWYTFEHAFRDVAGVLAVDLILRDSGGTALFTETRSDPSDLIPGLVGGNRYAWFTNIDINGGIAVDNHMLTLPDEVSAPATLGLLLLGLVLAGRRSRHECAAA